MIKKKQNKITTDAKILCYLYTKKVIDLLLN